jgi:hypothetical protein
MLTASALPFSRIGLIWGLLSSIILLQWRHKDWMLSEELGTGSAKLTVLANADLDV